MCAAAAQRARRLRNPGPGRLPAEPAGRGARSGDGRAGISEPKTGLALPRRTRPPRRAPARTASTIGCWLGDGTPARPLRAAIALHRAFVCAKLARRWPASTRNSAKTVGSAGSQCTPRRSAKPTQARSGPR
jgi:hypothetical protein